MEGIGAVLVGGDCTGKGPLAHAPDVRSGAVLQHIDRIHIQMPATLAAGGQGARLFQKHTDGLMQGAR